MLSFKARIGFMTGAALMAAGLILPAGVASAATSGPAQVGGITPDSASNCNPAGIELGTWSECTQVIGEGLEINSISGKLINWSPINLTEVHIEIYGPKGTIKNCAQFNLAGGATSPTCTWKNPNSTAQMPAGDYCSRAWEYSGNGSYADLSNECIDVHS
jgi:hypothetical protein